MQHSSSLRDDFCLFSLIPESSSCDEKEYFVWGMDSWESFLCLLWWWGLKRQEWNDWENDISREALETMWTKDTACHCWHPLHSTFYFCSALYWDVCSFFDQLAHWSAIVESSFTRTSIEPTEPEAFSVNFSFNKELWGLRGQYPLILTHVVLQLPIRARTRRRMDELRVKLLSGERKVLKGPQWIPFLFSSLSRRLSIKRLMSEHGS